MEGNILKNKQTPKHWDFGELTENNPKHGDWHILNLHPIPCPPHPPPLHHPTPGGVDVVLPFSQVVCNMITP